MKLIILVITLAAGSTPALASDDISESCTGTETVQVGVQQPMTVPYSIYFSADLANRSYCYDKCTEAQTYPISDGGSNPIKLAELKTSVQTRRLVYDRDRSVLTDYQIITTGPIRIERNASANCKAAKFTEPWSLSTSRPK